MQQAEEAASGRYTTTGEGGDAPRVTTLPKSITATITHDVIRRAFAADARHCPAATAIEDFGKSLGQTWRVVVDELNITVKIPALRVRLEWPTPRKVAAFVKLFDDGRVIDDSGDVHTVEEIGFRLATDEAVVTEIPERTRAQRKAAEKAGKKAAKTRQKHGFVRREVKASFHRLSGIRGFERLAGSILAEPADASA
jgi:hypothetical protein